uniref:Uncharacterized protein n=1 Tax=Ciona intestinalis TaxID=7719 RepID=F6SZH9_CIOIN
MNRTELHEAALNGRLLQLRKLIDQTENVNLLDENNLTPLHEACINGKSACVKLLLSAFANPNVEDVCGRTPLYFACWRGCYKCCDLLLQKGATVNNEACILAAIKCGSKPCIELLIKSGTKVTTSCLNAACSTDVKILKMLLLASADSIEFVSSALQHAIHLKQPCHVRLLLKFGANPFIHLNEETAVDRHECNAILNAAKDHPCNLKDLCRIWLLYYFHLHNKDVDQMINLPLPHAIKQYVMFVVDV